MNSPRTGNHGTPYGGELQRLIDQTLKRFWAKRAHERRRYHARKASLAARAA